MLTIVIEEEEIFDEENETFSAAERIVHNLEHSLISLSKWESKYQKPIHQGVEIGRISLAVQLGLECAPVGGVLVAINGIAHLPQIAAQSALFVALNGDPQHGSGDRGQDHQDGHRHDQLDQGETVPADRPRGRGLRMNWCKSRHTASLSSQTATGKIKGHLS